MAKKEEIEVAKEFYETFERLKYHDDFVKFKEGVVDKELERLREKILSQPNLLTKEGQIEQAVDTLLYRKLNTLFVAWFEHAEAQAKLTRKTIFGRRKKREKEEKEKKA